jgi:D-alanyl-lipoteichoic acid acyltransferase DltB (MBOAT superfamily)
MGYVFPQNFHSPYRATGFRDFWRRWHMTLSRFLRDFVYIPLGGNRRGRLMTYRNLMITMVLGGLWHGAAWTFVAWGAFHGVGLVTEHALGGRLRLPGWLRWAVTFHLVVFGWIVFRSESLHMVGVFLSRLVVPGEPMLWAPAAVLAIVVAIAPQLLPAGAVERVQLRIERARPQALAIGLAAAVVVAGATVSSQGVAPFIYFRF